MDRYWFYYGTTTKERDQYKSPNGDFVLYSDVEATERRLIEVEDMAAWYQQQHQQLVAERKALQARVRELEGVIRTMAKGDDYISPEELDDILKGPHDER